MSQKCLHILVSSPMPAKPTLHFILPAQQKSQMKSPSHAHKRSNQSPWHLQSSIASPAASAPTLAFVFSLCTLTWPNTLWCLYLRAEYKRRSFTVLKCTNIYRFWSKMSPPPIRDDDDDDDNDDHISSHFLSVKPSPSTLSTEFL
jgi:hypothetical protein